MAPAACPTSSLPKGSSRSSPPAAERGGTDGDAGAAHADHGSPLVSNGLAAPEAAAAANPPPASEAEGAAPKAAHGSPEDGVGCAVEGGVGCESTGAADAAAPPPNRSSRLAPSKSGGGDGVCAGLLFAFFYISTK